MLKKEKHSVSGRVSDAVHQTDTSAETVVAPCRLSSALQTAKNDITAADVLCILLLVAWLLHAFQRYTEAGAQREIAATVGRVIALFCSDFKRASSVCINGYGDDLTP